jgi:uncharacterized membrane protein YeaQ/YmgE (transglycosylase-associated protein family)
MQTSLSALESTLHKALSGFAEKTQRRIMENILGKIIFGLVIGIIAKFLMPGRDPGGFIITAIIGMAGAFIGTLVGRALWGGAGYEAGWIASIFGAIILLAGYRLIMTRRSVASS